MGVAHPHTAVVRAGVLWTGGPTPQLLRGVDAIVEDGILAALEPAYRGRADVEVDAEATSTGSVTRGASHGRGSGRAREVFERYGLDSPRRPVSDLSPTQRALLAIVRAVESMRGSLAEGHLSHGILVLDEPTVFLPREGTDQLFSLMMGIVENGSSIIFVSHDLDEVREITDRSRSCAMARS